MIYILMGLALWLLLAALLCPLIGGCIRWGARNEPRNVDGHGLNARQAARAKVTAWAQDA